MHKVLVVDDEKKIRETIKDYLKFKGMDVLLAGDGEEAVEIAYEENLDLIIMDVMMPVMDGIKSCQVIRETSDVPVLFLSALGEEENYLKGYAAGADDYIVKPFPLAVLYQKCQTMIGRYRGVREEHFLEANGVRIDLKKQSVFIASENSYEEVTVVGKSYHLLLYLMQNKGRAIHRDMILTKVWGYDFEGDSRVVDTQIKRLRKALCDKSSCIKTKINVGYYFEG